MKYGMRTAGPDTAVSAVSCYRWICRGPSSNNRIRCRITIGAGVDSGSVLGIYVLAEHADNGVLGATYAFMAGLTAI